MTVLLNEKRFRIDENGETKIVKESRVEKLPINTYFPQTVPFQVSKSSLKRQSQFLSFTDEEHDAFSVK